MDGVAKFANPPPELRSEYNIGENYVVLKELLGVGTLNQPFVESHSIRSADSGTLRKHRCP